MVSRSMSFAVGLLAAGLCAYAALGDGESSPIGLTATTDVADVCGEVDGLSYSRRHRLELTEAERRADFARAGVSWSRQGDYELDHRLSLALGGADIPENRWPQPWAGPWNAHDKDRLEIELWRRVCEHHTMPLPDAQRMLTGNWCDSYIEIFGRAPVSAAEGPNNGQPTSCSKPEIGS